MISEGMTKLHYQICKNRVIDNAHNYDEIQRALFRLIHPMSSYFFEWWAEYSMKNHNRCFEMLSNLDNPALIRQIGEDINRDGGMVALQSVFYIMINFLVQKEHKDYIKLVELYWNGVSEWTG